MTINAFSIDALLCYFRCVFFALSNLLLFSFYFYALLPVFVYWDWNMVYFNFILKIQGLSWSWSYGSLVVWSYLKLLVQSEHIITNVVSSNFAHYEVYSIQHYVIKFVCDLRQVGGFLRVFWFPPPIKLTVTDRHDITEIFFESGVKHHNHSP